MILDFRLSEFFKKGYVKYHGAGREASRVFRHKTRLVRPRMVDSACKTYSNVTRDKRLF